MEKPVSRNSRGAAEWSRRQASTAHRSTRHAMPLQPKIREGIQGSARGCGRVYLAPRDRLQGPRAAAASPHGPVPPGMHWDLWLGPAPESRTARRGAAAGSTSRNTATGKSATRGYTRWT